MARRKSSKQLILEYFLANLGKTLESRDIQAASGGDCLLSTSSRYDLANDLSAAFCGIETRIRYSLLAHARPDTREIDYKELASRRTWKARCFNACFGRVKTAQIDGSAV